MKDIKNSALRNIINDALGGYNSQYLLEDISNEGSNKEIVPIDKDLVNRTKQRLYTEELRRQKNLEDVFEIADNELGLKEESRTTSSNVDEEWTLKFIHYAKDISEKDLKRYWGKLLAGEINNPGTYSYRLMQFLSQLSSKDAESIKSFFRYAVFADKMAKALVFRNEKSGVISMTHLLFMQELGLLDSNDSLSINYNNAEYKTKESNLVFYRNGIGLVFSYQLEAIKFPIYKLTNLGKELLNLNADLDIDIPFLKQYADIIVNEHKGKVSAQCGKITFINSVQWIVKHDELLFECKYTVK